MTDREKRQLRGPVRTVRWDWFDWDRETQSVQERARRWEELTFSPRGDLAEQISSFADGKTQRLTLLYDEAGRLRERVSRDADGSEQRFPVEYDERGDVVDSRVKAGVVKYSTENGRKVKTEIFDRSKLPPGVAMGIGFEDGPQSFQIVSKAAVASTFYDERGRSVEIVFYDDEHVQISKLVRTYDERGRVKSEEQRVVSPRLFAGTQGTKGEEMPPELQKALTQALSAANHLPRISYQYDDKDRIIEQKQEMGLFGSERTVSEYNPQGDVSLERHYESKQRDLPLDDQGNIIPQPPSPEILVSETRFTYEYDHRGNWTRKSLFSRPEPGKEVSWASAESRRITYY